MGAVLEPRSAGGRTATRVRLTRAGAAVAVAFALLFVFYTWTATTPGNRLFTKISPFSLNIEGVDYYNLQADAFLHGRLWLDVPFDPKLLTAKNPYALPVPQVLAGVGDGSFYDGRYYLAWGPAPALTTFLPPRLVGLRIQEGLAVTLYCFFGVLFAAMTLTLLVRRLVPGTSRVVLWTGNATMALASAVPWILRTPTVYEVAISAGFFFVMAGLLVLVRELLLKERPRRGRLAGAGTLFGLAVLSRPTMVIVVAGIVGIAWVLRPETRRTMVPLIAGIPVIAGVLFMVYNMARFSGPLDFGNKWQTSGRDLRHFPFNDISNLPPALYAYLVAPLHPTVGFPYIQLPPPPAAPLASTAEYRGEPTGSLLWTMPFVLLALAYVVRRRRPTAGDDDTPLVRPIILILLGITALVLLAGAYGVPGYTERYKLDFVPWAVMAATLGWASLIQHASTRRRATWLRRGGIALGAWGLLVGVAVSFTGYYHSFILSDYGRYQSLERMTSLLPTLVTKIAGRPMISMVMPPLGLYTIEGGYTTPDVPGASFLMVPQTSAQVTIVSPGARDARLTFRATVDTPGTFPVYQSSAGQTTSVLVSNGSAATLPLHLRRGVNYTTISLAEGLDVPSGTAVTFKLRDLNVQ